MNDVDGIGCQRYSMLRDQIYASSEFTVIKDNLTATVIPLITSHTGLNLSAYEEALELCLFLNDAWTDGYDFKVFDFSLELQNNCFKVLES